MAEATTEVDPWQKLREQLEVTEPDLDQVKDIASAITDKNRKISSWSPVITAIKNNQEKVLDLLVKEGFSVHGILTEQNGIYGWCAVGAAIDAKNYKLAKHLVHNLEASADIVRLERETLLTTAITRSDWPIITLLLEELKASPNLCIQFDSNGGKVWPLHLAIWNDFYKGRPDWRMTKLFLKNGAKVATISDWDVLNGKILLGIQKGTKGNASAFAEALKVINQGRMEEQSLDCLIELLKEQNTIQDFINRINACQSVSLSGLAGLNNTKVFMTSPLVTAARHGRYDLVELMVQTLGFDVDAAEESTGLNPLAAAVESGNNDMVSYLVKELGAKVDAPLELELVPGKKFKCTTLAVAVDQDINEPEMWRLLVKELGADVNHEMEVNGLTSSLLHHAIYKIQDQKSTKILTLLLSYGAKADQISWAWLSHGLCQVTPMEHALRLQARSKDDLLWYDVADKLTNILLKEETEKLKKMEPEDLIHHVEKDRLMFEWHRSKMETHLEVLAQKAEAANQNVDKIKDLRSKKDFKTEEEIATKEKKFWQKVLKSKAIAAEIKSITKHENYMTEEKLQQKKAQAQQIESLCLVCEKTLLPKEMKVCKKKTAHTFCNRCTRNRISCSWCQSENFGMPGFTRANNGPALQPMDEFVEPIIAEAEQLQVRLQTLRESKELLGQEELEILARKHEAETDRAKVLNKLITSIKKIGDPDHLNQFKNCLRAVRTALGKPDDEKAKDLDARPAATAHVPTADPAVETLATAEPEATKNTPETPEAGGRSTAEEDPDLSANITKEAPEWSVASHEEFDSYDEKSDHEDPDVLAPAREDSATWSANRTNYFYRLGNRQGDLLDRAPVENYWSQAGSVGPSFDRIWN